MTNTTYGEDSFKGTDLSVVGRILSGRKIGDLHSLSVVKLTPIPRTEMSSCPIIIIIINIVLFQTLTPTSTSSFRFISLTNTFIMTKTCLKLHLLLITYNCTGT